MKEQEKNDNINSKEQNKNLPVVDKGSFWTKFRRKFQRSLYMALSVFGIVFPYVDMAADMMQAEPLKPVPPIKEEMKEDIEARYEQAFNELGIVVNTPVAEKQDIDIPDDPPQEEYDVEYKGEEIRIVGEGGDNNLDFYNELKGNVKDDTELYRKYKDELEKKKKQKGKDDKDKVRSGNNKKEKESEDNIVI